jgi:hypothetical protein
MIRYVRVSKPPFFLNNLNLQYLDDSPLYIFDSAFDDDPVSKTLLDDFTPPFYFPEDLFKLVGESRRPPYRWFLMGPMVSNLCLGCSTNTALLIIICHICN